MFTKVMSTIGFAVMVAVIAMAVTLLIMYNVETDIMTIGDTHLSVPLIELHPEVQNVVEAVRDFFM